MFVIEQVAFDGLVPVSMQLVGGECIGLNGESGCGKTRLLRALADMDVHQGTARLNGVAADDIEASLWRRQVALLPAESQWWFDTVGEHFAVDETLLPMLDALGFGEATLGWQLSRCSSGEKQRLAIVRLLANRPRVLLLDEPTANLDPDNTLKVEQLIMNYIAEQQAACIWVSHNLLQLKRVAGRRYQCIDGAIGEVCDE